VTLFSEAVIDSGDWSTKPYNWDGRNTTYLLAYIPDASILNASNTPRSVFPFRFNNRGNFTISLNTPGCLQDDTCDRRGVINITVDVVPPSCESGGPVSTQIYQTNRFDKYDQIYFGPIPGSVEDFQPSIILTPSLGQSQPGSIDIVAQAVKLESLDETEDSVDIDECGRRLNATAKSSGSTTITGGLASNTSKISDTSLPSQGNSRTYLSMQAKIGIGFGIGIIVIAILVGAFLLWRRRMKKRVPSKEDREWTDKPELPAQDVPKHKWRVEGGGMEIRELLVESKPQELEAEPVRAELSSR